MIIEYFNSLINQIDIKTEKLILQDNSNGINVALIEKIRTRMVQTIKEIERKNLENLLVIETEIKKILSKNIINWNEYFSIMNLIFKYFCVLVDRESLFKKIKISNSLGVLVTFLGYLSTDQLKIYKKFINNRNKTTPRKDTMNYFNIVRINFKFN